MQKLFVLFFFLVAPLLVFSQKKSIIKIVSFDTFEGETKKDLTYLRNPVFQQDNATLTCDSAVFYNKLNYFEAFKNVHIKQLTTDIYSDQLQYDGNTKKAHLTGNVQMIDPKSTLTTNILDYNTLSKIGTYTSGGKIVSQDVTLTSKNGYYFSNTNDAYFRYNVIVVTPQTTIKSDTMRYNTQTKWTYFYGPTNIKGKDDNLYTENGAYNTLTEDAYFGKKNLYTQGTKSLKGDSLYYFGKIGYGKAVKHIVFTDTKDGTKMFGDLGYYYKSDQRTLVTRNAYLAIVTADSIMVKNKKIPDSLWLGADTLETQMVLQKTLKLIPKISIKADNEVGEDEEAKAPKTSELILKAKAAEPVKKAPVSRKNKKDKNAVLAPDSTLQIKSKDPDSLKIKTDSLKLKPDSLLKSGTKARADSLLKSANLKNKGDSLVKSVPKAAKDSLPKAIVKNVPSNALNKAVSILKPGNLKADSIPFNPADTVQARIIKAYHGVKIYKSNIQAKTDSLFYTSADSTLRCFMSPIIWSQGSQQIGDTIYVQFKQNKLNNLQAFRNAFLVNTPADSLRFNQIKGRFMTGFFTDGKMKTLYVDGNAESIYYTQDDSTKVYKEMNQTVSSRIKFIFKDNDIQDVVYINSVEGALNPEDKVAKDNVLKGFSWKPTERPRSKKDAIGSSGKPKAKAKPKAVPGKNPPVKKPVATAEVKSTVQPKVEAPKIVSKTDSISKQNIKPVLTKPDSIKVEKQN